MFQKGAIDLFFRPFSLYNMGMKKRTWAERLRIPLTGNSETKFYTLKGLILATGYSRVVIGGRGPYVEFETEHIRKDNLYIPKHAEHKLSQSVCYYHEYRSKDECYVKAYYQQMGVSYADYVIGKWYIDPEKLKTDDLDGLLLPPYPDSVPVEDKRPVTIFDV